MYIPRVRAVCRNVPATPDPPKAHAAHSTSRMNWIELELVATVELDSLLDPFDADCWAAQHDRIGRRTARASMHQPPRYPSNDTRDQTGYSAEHGRAAMVRPDPDWSHAPAARAGSEGLWRTPPLARNKRGQTRHESAVANRRRPTAAVSLPLRMAARNGAHRFAPRSLTIEPPHRRPATPGDASRRPTCCHLVDPRQHAPHHLDGNSGAHGLPLFCARRTPAATGPLAIRPRVSVPHSPRA